MKEERKNKRNVPNLRFPAIRFPEFKEEWRKITLGSCSKYLDYGMNASACNYDGVNKYIRITDIDANSLKYKSASPVSPNSELNDKYLIEKNDILFARTGASTGKTYIYDSEDGKLYFAGFLIRARIKSIYNAYFIFAQTQTYSFNKWVSIMSMRSGQPGINSKEYSSLSYYIPSRIEQDKVATFLKKLDQRISTQIEIIDNLTVQLKNLSHKLLNQELRLQNDEGASYTEWELKKLSDVCEKMSSNISANKIEDNFGEYILYGASGILKYIDFYREENDFISIVKDGAGVGRLLYCMGKSSVLGTMDVIKPKKNINSHFLYYLLETINFTKYITGSTIPHIYFKDYKKETFYIPSSDEQTKIANFLNTISEKLETEKKLLEQFQNQKKYFLQNLFI